MEVTHYTDPKTNQLYREIRDKSYRILEDLQKTYKETKHKKTWLLTSYMSSNKEKGDFYILVVAL